MHKLLVSTILPHSHPRANASHAPEPDPSSPFTSLSEKSDPGVGPSQGYPDSDDEGKNVGRAPISEEDHTRRATLLVALHLLNPIVIGISTRGSSESVLSLLVLLTLFCAMRGRWDWTAVFLGLCTHWKIYPVIYGVSCVGVIGRERQRGSSSGSSGSDSSEKKVEGREVFPKIAQYIDDFINARTARFAVISAGTFFALGVCMYSV